MWIHFIDILVGGCVCVWGGGGGALGLSSKEWSINRCWGNGFLVAMATKILELATKLEPKSPAWRLKLRGRIESLSLI